jgi:hypothetical protein
MSRRDYVSPAHQSQRHVYNNKRTHEPQQLPTVCCCADRRNYSSTTIVTIMGETTKPIAPETRPGHHVVAILLTLCAFAFVYVLLECASVSNNVANNVALRIDYCGKACHVRRMNRLDYFDGRDLLNRHDLKKQLEDAKDRLIAKLKVDYGEYFDNMFVHDADGSFIPLIPFGDQSLFLLKRKLMIKLLQTQQELQRIEMNVNGCDCINFDGNENKDFTQRRVLQTGNGGSSHAALIESTFSKYVWVTGGHSAAAGHGNLYNESYTAFMERDLKDIFGSIGIDFEGRNYAMGGTASAAEMAMCWEEIFGADADFFSWDYGMIGRNIIYFMNESCVLLCQ